jgi:hypothetical protein
VASGLKLITLEIFLGFGVPVAWGVWQLVELRRLKKQDEQREAEARAQAAAGGTAAIADETSPAPGLKPPDAAS